MTRRDPASQPSSELFRFEQQTSLLVVLPQAPVVSLLLMLLQVVHDAVSILQ